MTDTTTEAVFLIEKRGLYYRPNAAGYTGIKSEAGRYTFDEAVVRVGPNGPDGPQDGMGIWHEDEAPDYSSSCYWDVRVRHERDTLAARVKALEAANEHLLKVNAGLLGRLNVALTQKDQTRG
jgi:hypothetical protein